MNLAKNIIATMVLLGGFNVSVSAGVIEDAINERLAPVGSVCVEGSDCAAATASASVAGSSEPRSGETVYNNACVACHSSGAAGAPKFGDTSAWVSRLSKGIDVLYANSINGINAMPAKGLCMDCSDDEIKATVDYMVSAAK